MDRKKQLIRDLHVQVRRLGITEVGYEGILAGYGVDSSTELNEAALTEICDRLHDEARKQGLEGRGCVGNATDGTLETPAEKERKRLKVAIGKLLAAQGKIKADGWGVAEWNLIAGTACRAAKVSRMDDIPASKCRGLIYEFNKQREGIEAAAAWNADNPPACGHPLAKGD